MNTDKPVRWRVNTLRLKWPKTELTNLRSKTTREERPPSSCSKLNREKTVSKHILSNTSNSTNSGMRTSSRPSKRTPKPLLSLKIDKPRKSRTTDKFLTRPSHSPSSIQLISLTSRRSKLNLPSKKTTLPPIKSSMSATRWKLNKETNI